MPNEMFTKRDGTQVPVPEFKIAASEMTSLLRLKEDFEARGEYLSLTGVVLHVIDKGISSTRAYWKNAETQSNKRVFATQAVQYFRPDGTISDQGAVVELAKRLGLVRGTAKQV